MDALKFSYHPDAAGATMFVAFGGWNNAGEVATATLTHLSELLGAVPFAKVASEPFFDYQQVRPQITVTNGVINDLVWPKIEFSHAETPSGHVVFAIGPEPQYNWQDFCRQFITVIREIGVARVVALGALLADVPHTRPTSLQGTASDPALLDMLDIPGADYEGPTGAVGALLAELQATNIESGSVWALVPHYVSVTPNPQGMLGLSRLVQRLVGEPMNLTKLEQTASEYESQISEAIRDNVDVQAYVNMLEGRADSMISQPRPLSERDLPTGDELAAELQRFLSSQDGEA